MTAPCPPAESRHLWTIGHWSCPESVFVDRLLRHDIDLLVDVRAQPGSRRSPQFDQERMPSWLAGSEIGYRHLPALAGRRRRQEVDPSINAGWRNASFHNYADYALGAAYQHGIDELETLADRHRVAVMCGEPMPWRCHRLLIANTMSVRGWTVWHLMGEGEPRRHELGRWGATPRLGGDGRLTYPDSPAPADDFSATAEST